MKKQIVLIHGGEIFETHKEYLDFLRNLPVDLEELTKPKKKKWKETLRDKLGPKWEVIYPEMPNNRWNDRYDEWKIYFEKLIPFLRDGVVLAGHSLGGIFLAKYLSENVFPRKIKAVFLLAAPYAPEKKDRPNYFGGFGLRNNLSLVTKQVKNVYLYQSKDDPVVPYSDVEILQKYLPEAQSVIFKNKGHFSLITFPELVKAIKSLS